MSNDDAKAFWKMIEKLEQLPGKVAKYLHVHPKGTEVAKAKERIVKRSTLKGRK